MGTPARVRVRAAAWLVGALLPTADLGQGTGGSHHASVFLGFRATQKPIRNKRVKKCQKGPRFRGPESTTNVWLGPYPSHFAATRFPSFRREATREQRRLPRCRSSAGSFWKLPAASLFSTPRPPLPAAALMRSPRSPPPRGGPRPPARARWPPLRGPPHSDAARRCSAPTYEFPRDSSSSLSDDSAQSILARVQLGF